MKNDFGYHTSNATLTTDQLTTWVMSMKWPKSTVEHRPGESVAQLVEREIERMKANIAVTMAHQRGHHAQSLNQR